MQRREVFSLIAAAMAAPVIAQKSLFAQTSGSGIIRPRALEKGDTVGVVAPGTAVSDPDDLARAEEALAYFKLHMKLGRHVEMGTGYKTRTPGERASDIEEMFENPNIDAVFAIRGGYGAAQLLDIIDYEIIAKNPKIFLGYSDVTALHLAIARKCNLITFHGPVLLSPFSLYTMRNFEKVLFTADAPGELKNPETKSGIRMKYPVRTVSPGKARGRLIGGNLTIISTMMGTPYEIETDGKIVLLEDVGEAPYRIDRMLTQLRLAGKFDSCAGVVFGLCSGCDPDGSQYSTWDPTLGEVIDNILGDMNIPVFYGLTFGHTADQLTLPIGAEAIMDADKGSMTLPSGSVVK
jgi:muramoyltetrapeptide carboxypeptidase